MVPQRPFFSGSPGCVRSSALIWLFSSAHSTRACYGGVRLGSVVAPRCPSRWRTVGFLLRPCPDHFLDFGRRDRGGSSRSWRVFVQRRQATVQKPVPPARCLLRHDPQLGRDLLILP